MGALDDEHIASLLGSSVHFEEKNNSMVISEKSKLLGTMKSEQKSRVDLEKIPGFFLSLSLSLSLGVRG